MMSIPFHAQHTAVFQKLSEAPTSQATCSQPQISLSTDRLSLIPASVTYIDQALAQIPLVPVATSGARCPALNEAVVTAPTEL